MYFTKWPIALILLLCNCWLAAQENLTGYWQPQFSLNYDVNGTYAHNFSLANRNYIFDKEQLLLKGRQLDLAHFSTLKIHDNQSIALGVQYRYRSNFENRGNELRFTQQYNVTHKPNVVRFGHRMRTEQRMTKSLTIHRFRYRFAMDFPLKGEKLDLGEPYFVGSFENLLSVSKSNAPQYDTRLSVQMGWQVGQSLKLQAGLEYRLEGYSSTLSQNVVFLLTTAQLSL